MSERLIRSAKESYVHDLISLDEFEQRVWDALNGVHPQSALVAAMKEVWTKDLMATTDAPGSVAVYTLTGVPSFATMSTAEIDTYMARLSGRTS